MFYLNSMDFPSEIPLACFVVFSRSFRCQIHNLPIYFVHSSRQHHQQFLPIIAWFSSWKIYKHLVGKIGGNSVIIILLFYSPVLLPRGVKMSLVVGVYYYRKNAPRHSDRGFSKKFSFPPYPSQIKLYFYAKKMYVSCYRSRYMIIISVLY